MAEASFGQDLTRQITAVEAESARREFRLFVKQAWHVVEPGVEFVGGYHIDAIADHLTFVSLGDIDDLVINIPPRHSKAIEVDTPVLTTWGWKAHGDLVPGDFVYGPDGQPKRVIAVTPHNPQPTYAVEFNDGSVISASEGHLWSVERDYDETPRVRRSAVVTTAELRCGPRPDSIPVPEPVQMRPAKLLIDPYVLGAWLGDGAKDAGCIYASEQDVWALKGYGHVATTLAAGGERTQDFHRVTIDGLHTQLRVMGLLGNKHIPEEYLESSVDQRWALLQGLMDTDGHVSKDGTCQFSNNNESIANDVLTLVRSLGMRGRIDARFSMLNGKRFGPHYRVIFIPRSGETVFRLHRKQKSVIYRNNPRSRRRYVKSVTPLGERMVSCIQVEGEIYLVGRDLVPTHNSTICAVMWPAWEWTWMPWTQWLFTTYAQNLTLRDSVKCRRLIQSPWYRERWGHMFRLSGDLNQKGRFDNNRNGYRLATSVGGTATGEGGDRLVVDDAHNMNEINSDTIRGGVIDWWRDTMSTRLNNPSTGARVIIAQRGHHMDLPGHVLSNGGWVHLNMPGYYRKATHCQTIAQRDGKPRHPEKQPPAKVERFAEPLKKGELIWEDWRKHEDQLLAPKRFNVNAMRKLQSELTERGFEAQIQQNPSAEGGNILKIKHWRRWEDIELPACSMIIQVYDTAFEEEEENDYTARTTWGIFDWRENPNEDLPWQLKMPGQSRLCAILLERMNERLAFPELREEAKKSAGIWKPDRILIEKKASGHSLAQELKRADLPVSRIKVKDSKFARTHAAALVLERGCLWYVNRTWAWDVINQCAEFPSGEHDDLHDTVVLCALWLRRRWEAEFTDDDDNVDLMPQSPSKQRKRIYG